MTEYAPHRFSVGQELTHSGKTPTCCRVIAQITSPNGPEYRITDGSSETVVAERELTYRMEPPGGARPRSVFH